MTMCNQKNIIIRRSRMNWRITWSISLPLFIIDRGIGVNFFYLHYYLFFVGVLALLFSLYPYAKIFPNGISLYIIKFVRPHKLEFSWNAVKCIYLSGIKKSFNFTAGDYVRAPAAGEYTKKTVSLELEKKSLPDRMVEEMLSIKAIDFGFTDKGDFIEATFKSAPEGGNKLLLSNLNLAMEKTEDKCNVALKSSLGFILIYDFAILGAFCFLLSL